MTRYVSLRMTLRNANRHITVTDPPMTEASSYLMQQAFAEWASTHGVANTYEAQIAFQAGYLHALRAADPSREGTKL